jgi:hypothetical protein
MKSAKGPTRTKSGLIWCYLKKGDLPIQKGRSGISKQSSFFGLYQVAPPNPEMALQRSAMNGESKM